LFLKRYETQVLEACRGDACHHLHHGAVVGIGVAAHIDALIVAGRGDRLELRDDLVDRDRRLLQEDLAGLTETVIGCVSAFMAFACVSGRSIGTPTVIIGAATMKMMRRTSMTSTSGVTLISLIALLLPPRRRRPPPDPLAPPTAIPISVVSVL
jgi:hypothetical protein